MMTHPHRTAYKRLETETEVLRRAIFAAGHTVFVGCCDKTYGTMSLLDACERHGVVARIVEGT